MRAEAMLSTGAVNDPYEVLGIGRDADAAQIKAAFRKLAALHHPDKNLSDPSAAQRFKQVNAAYQILSDPKKKVLYDRFGAAGLGAARGGGGATSGVPFDLGDLNIDGLFGDLLDVLGIKVGDRGNLQVGLDLTFEEAAFGCTKGVDYERVCTCDACGGTGATKGTPLRQCGTCQGRGRVRLQQGVFPIAVERTCPGCQGSGRQVVDPCRTCRGVGLRAQRQRVEVSVPAGVESGSVKQLTGKGNMVKGRRPGDLEVVVHVAPHPFFRRAGDNVICSLPVTFAQAALGDEIEIPTLEGKGLMRVPGGTQPGTLLRVRGKGIPRRLGGRGDQLVEVQVEVPTELNDAQRALVMQLAEELGESVQPQRRTFVEKLRGLFRD